MPNFKGGVESVVEMLNLLDAPARKKLLASVAARDPELARKIESRLFTFEDFTHVAGREMQELIRAIPEKSLALALRKSSDDLKNHFYSNMSPRAADSLRDELRTQPPQKLSEVEKAQRDIVEIAKKLQDIGRILLKKN